MLQKVARIEQKVFEIPEVAKKLPSNLCEKPFIISTNKMFSDKAIKANEEQDFCFCMASRKSSIKFFLELFVRGKIYCFL